MLHFREQTFLCCIFKATGCKYKQNC